MYDSSQVAFIDIETTGLHPTDCDVWEIAIIVDEEEHVWQNRIRPQAQIDPWVQNPENTRFSEQYDKWTALSPYDTGNKLVQLLGPREGEKYGRHLVGACPWFDSQRLHHLLMWNSIDHYGKADHPWHYHLLDVECLALGYLINFADGESVYDYPNINPLKLPIKSEDISRMIGVEPPSKEHRHTALGDARWAKAMFDQMFG